MYIVLPLSFFFFSFQVLFAWPEDWSKNYEKGERFVSMLRGAVNARKAVMVLKGDKRLPSTINPVYSVFPSSRTVEKHLRICFCGNALNFLKGNPGVEEEYNESTRLTVVCH